MACKRTDSKYSGQLSGSTAFALPLPLDDDCLAVRGFFDEPSLVLVSETSAEASVFRFLPCWAGRCRGGILLDWAEVEEADYGEAPVECDYAA